MKSASLLSTQKRLLSENINSVFSKLHSPLCPMQLDGTVNARTQVHSQFEQRMLSDAQVAFVNAVHGHVPFGLLSDGAMYAPEEPVAPIITD
jgi:hypothetical protein